jgi:hypothetical protein
VFIVEPQLIPSNYARQEWQMQQEKNLQFTRAKQNLLICAPMNEKNGNHA